MEWILDNLQIVIAIAGAIAYWLNARAKDKAGEPADYDGDGTPDNVPGGSRSMREHERAEEQAEAMRRIQEEIRRKIAERNGGAPVSPQTPASAPPPMPVSRLEAFDEERARRARLAEERRAASERETSVVMERQRKLEEQLAVLKARKAAANREADAVWGRGRELKAAHAEREAAEFLKELRDARSLRKAIVLREVLGAPAGLR